MSNLRQAAQQALEAHKKNERHHTLAETRYWCNQYRLLAEQIIAALAESEQEPVARAWQEGYNQGVQDERTSEASIGIVGFGAKVEPARQNPYRLTAPTPRRPLTDEEIDALMPPLPVTNVIVDGLWEEQYGPYTADQMRDYALDAMQELARAIERAHDIGEQT